MKADGADSLTRTLAWDCATIIIFWAIFRYPVRQPSFSTFLTKRSAHVSATRHEQSDGKILPGGMIIYKTSPNPAMATATRPPATSSRAAPLPDELDPVA